MSGGTPVVRYGRTGFPAGPSASGASRDVPMTQTEVVLAQSHDRVPELVPIRHGRMAATPWTHYRGAAAVMAADLATADHSGLEVQLCGDATS